LIISEELLKVVFRTYDESLFEQDLARCIDKATNGHSITAGFTIANQDDKIKLRLLLDRYRNKEFKETPLLDRFNELAEIVGNSYS
jgi:hypothetical protein